MIRKILTYVFGFRRRRTQRAARERLERLGQSPEDWGLFAAGVPRPMDHPSRPPPLPQGDAKDAEQNARYVPTWAKPMGKG